MRPELAMMIQTMYMIARMTPVLVGITTFFLLVSFALSHLWITCQLIVVVILKLSISMKNSDTGCPAALAAAAAAFGLESWNDELDPSYAAHSYYASPDEPMPPPEIIKEVLEEEEEEDDDDEDEDEDDEDGDERDVHEVMTSSLDEIWRTIAEARRRVGRRALDRSGTWGRYRRRVDADAEWVTPARREQLMRRTSEPEGHKKKDQVDVKALQKEVVTLGAWPRPPREVTAGDVGQDELFRRVETFIRMQQEHLRQQQRESERRRLLERLHQRSS